MTSLRKNVRWWLVSLIVLGVVFWWLAGIVRESKGCEPYGYGYPPPYGYRSPTWYYDTYWYRYDYHQRYLDRHSRGRDPFTHGPR